MKKRQRLGGGGGGGERGERKGERGQGSGNRGEGRERGSQREAGEGGGGGMTGRCNIGLDMCARDTRNKNAYNDTIQCNTWSKRDK